MNGCSFILEEGWNWVFKQCELIQDKWGKGILDEGGNGYESTVEHWRKCGQIIDAEDLDAGKTKRKMMLERQVGPDRPWTISFARTKSLTCHKQTEDAQATFTDTEVKWHDERSLGNSSFKSALPTHTKKVRILKEMVLHLFHTCITARILCNVSHVGDTL